MEYTSSRKAYFIAFCIASVVFANHFCRDTPGALERELEASVMDVKQYHTLQSVFFLPNILSPLVASFFEDTANLLIYTTTLASVGTFVFAFGAHSSSVGVMYLGRFLSGCMYELIDVIPIILLGPLMKNEWGSMVGVMNAFLRCGSILNFLIIPMAYKTSGLSTALFVSAAVGTLMVLFAWIARTKYVQILREEPEILSSHSGDEGDKLEGGGEGEEEDSTRHWLLRAMPFDRFPRAWYYYTASGFFLYGSMVPFWFLGSKYLQLKYGFDILVGDAFMLLPEGLIVLLGPLVGIYLDRMKFSTRTLLLQLAAGIALLPVAYLVLTSGSIVDDRTASVANDRRFLQMVGTDNSTWSPSPGDTYTPIVPIFNVPGDISHGGEGDGESPRANPLYAYLGMVLAGSAYAVSNSLFWTLITSVCSKKYLSQQSGVIASAMNILPTALPPLIVAINLSYKSSDKDSVTASERGLVVLAASGAMGALCAGLAALAWQETQRSGSAEELDADVEMQSTTYNRLSHDSTHSNHSETETERETGMI